MYRNINKKIFHIVMVIVIIFAILCFSVGCLSKAVYIPLILLIMLLPQLKAVKKRQAIIWELEY